MMEAPLGKICQKIRVFNRAAVTAGELNLQMDNCSIDRGACPNNKKIYMTTERSLTSCTLQIFELLLTLLEGDYYYYVTYIVVSKDGYTDRGHPGREIPQTTQEERKED